MATLREIKKRITNIAVIERITQSMKAVATSKLAQVKTIRDSNADFFKSSNIIFSNLLNLQNQLNNTDNDLFNKIFKKTSENIENNTPLIIFISSDRGLCGAYNSNVFRYTDKYIKSLKNKNFKLLAIGNKAYAWGLKTYENNLIKMPIVSDFKVINQDNFMSIVLTAMSLIKENTVNSVEVIYSANISVLSQEVRLKKLLPIEENLQNNSNILTDDALTKNIVIDNLNFKDILENLVVQYLSYKFYELFLVSAMAEYSSRMNAMDNASENSKELKDKLKLIYNRSRQGIITKELTEIIAGVEAS